MWIEELKDGRFKYFERYTDPYTGKYRRTSTILNSKSSRAQKQAKNILDEKIDKLLAKATTSDAYFTDVLQEWWELHKKDLKASTIRIQGIYIDQLIKNFAIGVPIVRIDALYVQKYFNNLPQTRSKNRHLKTILNQCFEYAIDMGYVQENPINRLRLPQNKKTLEEFQKISQKFLEEDEIKRLLDELYSNPITYRSGLLAEFMSLSGLRFGEVVALEIKDVDLENRTLEVNGTYFLHAQTKTTPKTLASYRTVSLTTRETEIINEYLKIKELDSNTNPNFQQSDFIFVSRHGKPVSVTGFNKMLKDVNQRLDQPINKQLSSHIFRHTLISRLATHNIPLKAIMDKVGHSNSKATNEIYTHVTKNMKTDLMQVLEKY